MGTYSRLITHVTFSTKERRPSMNENIRPRLLQYLSGIVRELHCVPIRINGVEDHVHLLVQTPPSISISDFMRVLKTNSSHWVHETQDAPKSFAWQGGYGAFTVDKGNVERVHDYIANQEQHHRKQTFQEEFIGMLQEARVPYDERYIWA